MIVVGNKIEKNSECKGLICNFIF